MCFHKYNYYSTTITTTTTTTMMTTTTTTTSTTILFYSILHVDALHVATKCRDTWLHH